MAALTGALATGMCGKDVAFVAYNYADAMMEARKK